MDSCDVIQRKLTLPWVSSLEAELEAVLRKMDTDRVEYEQKLERQAQLLDTKAAKIKKLEGISSSGLSRCPPLKAENLFSM